MNSNYPALSPMWRLDQATKNLRGNGKTNRHSDDLSPTIITEHGHSRVLIRTRQIFPLALFRDEIIVEELRIVWLKAIGPWMNEVVSIMATDIASVNCSTGLFFGHIHVQSLTGGPEIMVNSLLRRDVLKIRSLVEGIAMSAREGLKIQGESYEAEKQSLMTAGSIN